jgi:DNA polymerase I-like protein with 3'-5' exonuclease and polymerase domains
VKEAEETEMQAMLDEGKKVYVETMKEYYRDPTLTKNHPKYITFKSLCHGTNYLGKTRGLAAQTGLLVQEVERVQQWYLGKFPRIKTHWHDKITEQLSKTRQVINPFGFRRFYFDRLDSIINEAIAWIPQSTVALVINHALCNIAENLPEVEVLLQVHDSLAMQTDTEKLTEQILFIQQQSLISIPYPTPLIIPVGFKTSPVSWGDCRDYKP